MRNLLKLALASAAVIATPALAGNIDTTGSDTGTVFNFGYSNTATYGQTFTVGAGDTVMSSFSLYLRDRYAGQGTLDLRGYVATWDGSKAGSLLYSSGVQTMNGAGNLQEFAFNTGSLAVTPGQQLVAFLSISGLGAQNISQFGMPNGGDSIPGQFVFMNNGDNFGMLFSSNWSQGYLGQNDVWFKAGFGAGNVPEPATWALLILGFGAVGATMRRKQVRTAVSFA